MKLQVGVKALIQNDKGQFLFLKRDSGEADIWDVPGSHLDSDEELTLIEFLTETVRKQTNLQISDNPGMAATQDIVDRKAGVHEIRLTYEAGMSGVLKTAKDIVAFKWLHADKALNLKTDPYLQAVLQHFAATEQARIKQ
ncbi:MAG TPA: NUDIX domain-containing protein [Candidatus Saccharimonadales bacterium]|nr:NUDIX domain-containing protein [Candidatus Saccharimonadales bacterium]